MLDKFISILGPPTMVFHGTSSSGGSYYWKNLSKDLMIKVTSLRQIGFKTIIQPHAEGYDIGLLEVQDELRTKIQQLRAILGEPMVLAESNEDGFRIKRYGWFDVPYVKAFEAFKISIRLSGILQPDDHLTALSFYDIDTI